MAILSASNSTWSTVRDATAGASADSSWVDTAGVGLGADFDGANYRIVRGWFSFNISLPSNATVTSSFLRLSGTSTRFTNANTSSLNIVQSTVVSDTVLATGDFDLRGTTSWGDLALSSWSQAGNNDIALNATGISNIPLSGYFKIAVTNSRDTSNTAPTGINSVTFDPTTSNQILSITYTVPPSGGSFLYNFIK